MYDGSIRSIRMNTYSSSVGKQEENRKYQKKEPNAWYSCTTTTTTNRRLRPSLYYMINLSNTQTNQAIVERYE